MNTEVLIAITIGVTIFLVVVGWQGMSVAKTEISSRKEEEYQKLAEKVVDAEQKNAEVLEDIRTRLTAIEKLLSDVQ